jgi:hypothetical protein
MSNRTKPAPTQKPSRTRILFDLAAEITPEELARFEASAAAAGTKDLTEHFLNLNLRLPKKITGPAG